MITRKKKREAKALTIEVWTLLAEHPEWDKDDLPLALLKRIYHLRCRCPLCELFYGRNCRGCPLRELPNPKSCPYWRDWELSRVGSDRTDAAMVIVELTKGWKA